MIKSKHQIRVKDRAVISHFSFIPPLKISADLENQACFIFPINLEGVIYRTDGKKEVGKEEGVLMKCGTYINKWQAIDPTQNSEIVIIRLFPDILSTIFDNDVKSFLKRSPLVSSDTSSAIIELDELLKRYLESLLFYFDNPQLVSEELALLKIKELSLLLLKSEQSNPIKSLFLSLFEPTKFSLKEIVDLNVKEHLSLDELAALSNMSTPTFKRKFKNLIGVSPGQYIKNQRIELAALELKNTQKTIAEIAFDFGFQDPNYFSKSFSKRYGLAPTHYRNL